MSKFSLTGDEASRVMLDGLVDRIRSELRVRILARIEPDIEAAIDASLEAFKVAIDEVQEPGFFGHTIRVLIERKDKT